MHFATVDKFRTGDVSVRGCSLRKISQSTPLLFDIVAYLLVLSGKPRFGALYALASPTRKPSNEY